MPSAQHVCIRCWCQWCCWPLLPLSGVCCQWWCWALLPVDGVCCLAYRVCAAQEVWNHCTLLITSCHWCGCIPCGAGKCMSAFWASTALIPRTLHTYCSHWTAPDAFVPADKTALLMCVVLGSAYRFSVFATQLLAVNTVWPGGCGV